MSTAERIGESASRIVRVVGDMAAWSGLALVLVVAGNVLARYLFSLSSVALQELEWHLMAVAALFGMAYGINRGAEVRVDVLYSHLPERLQALIDLAGALMLGAASLFIAWLCIAYVQSSWSIGEGSPDPGGLPMRWILKAMMPVAFVLLVVQAFATAVEATSRLARRDRAQKPGE